MHRPVRRTAIGALLALAAGCSSPPAPPTGVEPPPAPVLDLTVAPPKTLHFTWNDVAGETEYRLLEDPDGASGLAVVATLPADAASHDLDVFLPARHHAAYVLRACNAGGCSDSGAVSPGGETPVAYVKAPDPASHDSFGFQMTLSGDGATLAVGAFGRSAETGAVHVFARAGDAWSLQASLEAEFPTVGDRFGWSTALSQDGSTLAVGAVFENSNATGIDGDGDNELAPNSGAAYVFVRDGTGAWSQQAYLKASNPAAYDSFGVSVTLDAAGDTLVVGAYEQGQTGAAYVFTRTGTAWEEDVVLKGTNTTIGDWFGQIVVLSRDGRTLGISSTRQDDVQPDSGAVYVFVLEDGTWTQQTMLKASNPATFALFGIQFSFSADGNVLAVGARREASAATGIDGDQGDVSATDAGAVYVFERTGTTWSQHAYIKPSNTKPNAQFGISVGLTADGTTLAVAALGEPSGATGIDGDQDDVSAPGAGAVYVFMRSDDGAWSQQAFIKAPNAGAGDNLTFVRLSDDGGVLAFSAPSEAGDGTSLEDDSLPGAGAVYVY